MTRCLTPTEIEALRTGKLSSKDRQRAESHIVTCETCRSQVESKQAESQLAGDIKQAYQKQTVSSPGRSPKSSGETAGAPPKRIGPYQILEVLGEGGMGIVYLAEQTKPVRRRVALKLIKLGMDTKQVLARLEAERQALSMMNHPNVATLLDAGATEQGRPYFVMEHVPGVPITDYCDRHRLSTAERLDLFMQVCQGIQHAHQKGIIHRDIKPSNVLVAVEGDKPVPKVIDFGVAKATQHKLTERTLFTEQGQLIGTPEYMSPEQAEMTALDIDTRTDIYSLGVLLYELLVGALPFDPTSLREAAFAEIQRIIREVEPPKPSTRLSSLGDESTTAAQKRHTDRTSLERQLRGDLDWITMKAIEKDRTRRYATAAEFADDIARHLRHEPVLASPPSAAYRARKFIRRNKGPVAATGILLAVLAGGVITSTTFAIQATRARDAAQRQVKMTQSINDFLNNDLLAAVAPEQQGKDVLMRDVLDTASKAIEGKFDDAPLIEASIRSTLGNTYRKLGDYSKAEPHLVRALEIRRAQLGAEHEGTLVSMNNLGILYWYQGRFDEAEPLYVKTLELRRRVLGEEHPRTLDSMGNLAILYSDQGRYDEAEPLYVKTLEVRRRVLGEEHPNSLDSMHNLGLLYWRQGRFDEAEPLVVKALQLRRRVLGAEHPATQETRRNLFNLFKAMGKVNQARPLAADVLAGYRKRANGPNATAISMNNYAWELLTCAVPDLRDPVTALEFAKKAAEASNDQNSGILDTLALAQQMNGDIDAAIMTETKAVALLPPGTSALRSEVESNFVKYLLEGQRFAKAEPLLLAMHEQIVGSPPRRDESPSQTQVSIERLAKFYESWHAAEPGQGYDAKAAEWRAKLPAPQAPTKP